MNEQELKEWREVLEAIYKECNGRFFTLEIGTDTRTEIETTFDILKYCMTDVWDKKECEKTMEINYSNPSNYNVKQIPKFLNEDYLTYETSNIFFTPHIFNFKGGRENNNVKWFTCLYADIDHATIEEAEKRLKNSVLPAPSLKIFTGHGVHIYWILSKNAWAESWHDTWLKAQYFITDQLKSDDSVNQPCKVMRMPFTYNNKDEVPIKTKIFYKNLDNTVDLQEFYDKYLKNSSLPNLKQKIKVRKDSLTDNNQGTTIPKLDKRQQKRQDKRIEKNTKKIKRKNGYATQLRKDIYKVIEIRNQQDYNWVGIRHNVCVMLHVLNFGEEYIRDLNEIFGLPEYELNSILLGFKNDSPYMRRENIYRRLDLTREEVEELGLVMLIEENDAILKSNIKVLDKELKRITKIFRDYYFYHFVNCRLEKKKSKADIARELGFIDSNKKPNATEINRILKKEINKEEWLAKLTKIYKETSQLVNTYIIGNEEHLDEELVKCILEIQKQIKLLDKLVNNNEELTASNKFKVTVLKKKYTSIKAILEEIFKDDRSSVES